jgi:putative SOS response-associated peptidase YedK
VEVHNRMMPVILAPKHYERWLTREDTERPPIDLRRPFPPESMTAHEASRDVGNVRNNNPMLKILRTPHEIAG